MPTNDMRQDSPLRACIRYCRGMGEKIYAVVDAARDVQLAQAAWGRFGRQMLTLFDEPGASRLSHVAPYLVPIDFGSDFLDLWADRLHSSAGILMLTEAGPTDLRAHLRTIFRVTDEQGEEYFFRFYDPRVLRAFLPTCTPQEARELFGPIRCLLIEAHQPGVMLSCRADRTGVKVTERSLAPAGSAAQAPRARP